MGAVVQLLRSDSAFHPGQCTRLAASPPAVVALPAIGAAKMRNMKPMIPFALMALRGQVCGAKLHIVQLGVCLKGIKRKIQNSCN